jgi:hypothetical protein
MKRSILAAALISAAATSGLAAQPTRTPMGPRPGQGPMPGAAAIGPRAGGGALDDPASFLLAQTGELRLTDAQVTRLAAIARRSAERRRSMRAQVDSMRPERPLRGQRPDSAARDRMRQRFEQMRPNLERLRDQAQADRRDAIAVLTPDQQAMAWERIAMRGQMRRSAPGRGGARGFGPGRPGLQGGPMPGGRMRGPGPRRPPGDQ